MLAVHVLEDMGVPTHPAIGAHLDRVDGPPYLSRQLPLDVRVDLMGFVQAQNLLHGHCVPSYHHANT